MIKSDLWRLSVKPNVGKSSLLNKLIGEKLRYFTNTRNHQKPILGALTTNEYQIIFVDTLCMGKNFNLLSKKLTKFQNSMDDNDVIYYVVDRKYHESQKEVIEYFKEHQLKYF